MGGNGTLKHITTCRLCGQRFANPALPVIGDKPDAQTRDFIEALIKHLHQIHREAFAQYMRNMLLLSNQFAAWLALQSFETGDPNLRASQEKLRNWVHSLTRKNQLTDAEITSKIVAAEPLSQESAEAVCKEIRDYLTEQGRYAPQT